MTLAASGGDKPLSAMAATLVWIAADASVPLAASALTALSLFADAETSVEMYLEQTEVLLQPSSPLARAMRCVFTAMTLKSSREHWQHQTSACAADVSLVHTIANDTGYAAMRRRLDVLDAAAAEKADTVPLLLAQATQSRYRVASDPEGTPTAEQRQLVRQQVDRGLLAMVPAACRAATAVAAAELLTR